MKKNKARKISGWFIYWEGINLSSDEWSRIIFIDQTRNPEKPKYIKDFVEKYYISTMYLSEKINLISPKTRLKWINGSKINYNKDGSINCISCGHTPYIVAQYRKNVPVPDKDYPTWFPK